MAAAVLQFVSFTKETKLGDEIELKLSPVNISGVLQYSRSEECLFEISRNFLIFSLRISWKTSQKKVQEKKHEI